MGGARSRPVLSYEHFVSYVADVLDVEPHDVVEGDMQSGNFDSIAVVELFVLLEEEFGYAPDLETLARINTVGDLYTSYCSAMTLGPDF